MKQFYLSKDGQNYGPMTVDQMLQYGVDANSLVWTDGMQDWTPAGQVAEFMPYFAQYQQPVQPQYQQPAQPQYQQYAQQQYQQYAQPQYQQPVQQQYQQAMKPRNVKSMRAEETNNKGTASQLIFRIISFIPAVALLILSFIWVTSAFIILIAGSTSAMIGDVLGKIFSVAGDRVAAIIILILIWFITLFITSTLLVIRLIKNRGFGILGMGLYLISMLMIIISAIVVGDFAATFFFLFLFCLLTVYFAAVPIEDLGNGKHYKKMLAEASAGDYVLLGILLLISIIMFCM